MEIKNTLQELSMILPIKDNMHMLDDILQYHVESGVQMHILHDCNEAYTLPAKLQHANNIHYYHMPGVSYGDRVRLVLQKINTEFCVFRADRRHQCNTSLARSLKFLQENPDYSSASGIWLLDNLHLYHTHELLSCNGELDDPLMRVTNQVLNYQPPFYNVHRVNLSKAYFDILLRIEQKIPNIYYHEFVQAFLCFYLGKTKQFKSFSGVVQKRHTTHDYETQWEKAIEFFMSKESADFMTIILKNVLKRYGFEHENIAEAVHKLHYVLIVRFIVYRVNMCSMPNEQTPSFGYLENILSIFNGKVKKDDNFLELYTRALTGFHFDITATYQHIHGFFDQSDQEELNNMMVLVDKIVKKQ